MAGVPNEEACLAGYLGYSGLISVLKWTSVPGPVCPSSLGPGRSFPLHRESQARAGVGEASDL